MALTPSSVLDRRTPHALISPHAAASTHAPDPVRTPSQTGAADCAGVMQCPFSRVKGPRPRVNVPLPDRFSPQFGALNELLDRGSALVAAGDVFGWFEVHLPPATTSAGGCPSQHVYGRSADSRLRGACPPPPWPRPYAPAEGYVYIRGILTIPGPSLSSCTRGLRVSGGDTCTVQYGLTVTFSTDRRKFGAALCTRGCALDAARILIRRFLLRSAHHSCPNLYVLSFAESKIFKFVVKQARSSGVGSIAAIPRMRNCGFSTSALKDRLPVLLLYPPPSPQIQTCV